MTTYKELFQHLQTFEDNYDIRKWLSTDRWTGKDKQESILRLFARLGLIPKLGDFCMCTGNFNLRTIKRQVSFRDIFLTPTNKEIILKDKGDTSDLSGFHKSIPKHILASTSKCLKNLYLNNMDIQTIITNYRPYERRGYTMTLCVVVKDAQEFYTKVVRSERTTREIKKIIDEHQTIVIDWNDLNEAYHQFRKIYGKMTFEELIGVKKPPLVLRLHQRLCCMKTMRMKETTKAILWGQIQRSGKSYSIGGVIIEDSRDKTKCNYLVMTTAPKETINQYFEVFGYAQFDEFNVVYLDGKSRKPKMTDKNIIICSKQFLQTKMDEGKDAGDKTRSIPWLKRMEFDMRFVDESHNGGSTALARKTLETYGDGATTIYITATYSKPTQEYKIPREHWVLWDLEDIRLCKKIDEEKSVERLIEKHGEDIRDLLEQYSKEKIKEDFNKYPELEILTMNINPDILPEILRETRDNAYGWCPEACFLLKQGVDEKKNIVYKMEFQNREENLKLWHTIFGKYNRFGIPDKEYPDELVFMKRIEKICKNPETSSRYIDDMEQNVIMAFLPSDNIDLVSKATKELLEKEKVVPDYDILCINSKTTSDPKQAILDAKTRAQNMGKKGVLVLSGRQCSLGVTIDDCDIVLMLNNSNSYDMIFQMMFRCMTEGEGKRKGFVVDPNIHRVIQTILLEYACNVRPHLHPKEGIKCILQERLMNLNSDHWMPCFGHASSELSRLTESVYEVYTSKLSGAVENLFRKMSLKHELLSKNDYEMMNTIFNNLHLSKEKKKRLLDVLDKGQSEENIKKGIEKIRVQTDGEELSCAEEERRIDPIDILRPISMIICVLTIHDEEKTTLEEMYSLVDDDDKRRSILLSQTRVWWGKGMSTEDVERLVSIFQKYLEKDKETTMLIRQVKELFCKNVKNSKELSKIIDRYLIPQENEMKKNAEVSTPRELRQEMLDKMPEGFWEEKRKVFEPCSGKGGFLLDIVERFMNGLMGKIEDEKQRYKEIVEECLYFSDINDMNIFICRLLLDPYIEYKLNYNEGDTLKLDIKEKWGVEGFDAVIGNPPYQDCNASGDNKLYLSFTKFSHKRLLLPNGILLFITPTNIIDYLLCVDKNRRIFDRLQDIRYIAINTPKKFFNVNSTFTYFLMLNDSYKNTKVIVEYIDVDSSVSKTEMYLREGEGLPRTPSKMVLDILSKITTSNKREQYEFKTFRFKGRCQRIRSQHIKKGIVSKIQNEQYKYPIVDTINKKNPEGLIYYYPKLDDDIEKNKIVFSRKGYLMPTYDESHSKTYSDNFMFIEVEDDNLLILFKSRIIDFLCKQYSKNGFDLIHSIQKLRKINKRVSDISEIYMEYNLTEEEINCI